MKLSRPTNTTFLLSLILFIAALAGRFAGLAIAAQFSYELLLAAYLVLLLGNLLKGL